MARLQLLLHQVHLPSTLATLFSSSSNSTTILLLCVCAAAAISIVFSLCGTHKHSKMARKNKTIIPFSQKAAEDNKLIGCLTSIMGSKAMSLTKMVSWKKTAAAAAAAADHDQGDSWAAEDEALWKKTIIMGEKCRPIDFSGQILYDSEGNRLPAAPEELPESQRGDGQVLTAMEKV